MQFSPSLEEVKKIAAEGKYDIVPIYCEILSDAFTPIELMRIFKNVSTHCYMLESVSPDETWGRYTFMGYDPKLEISCADGIVRAGEVKLKTNNLPDFIRGIMDEHKSPRINGLPGFTGGLAGYFSYDFLSYTEPAVRIGTEDEEGFRDLDLMLFDKVIVFDNYTQKLILIANTELKDTETGYNKAVMEIKNMISLIRTGAKKKEAPGRLLGEPTQLFTKEAYCEMAEKAKHYIKEGDIFQVVLSNRLSAPYEGSLFNAYRVLRTINPSPYMFYFSGTDVEFAGASPETLVKLEEGVLHTFPLAGTRPRGRNSEEDERLEQELLKDEKELAEHNMLVDLGRNDLGRVSRFGSVEVENLHMVLKYSHVMHIGSTVRGVIREDKDAIDAVSAVLPAGTLSGAPKIRACQIIAELENNKRGIYGGAVGYLAFNGDMDTCIAIRLAYKKNGKVFVRSGAGIVADSVPEKEYQECINKAAAVVSALKKAEEDEL